jgi:heterodisulfide reductase subunit A-like polyferredoxin/coenzyme F420-reducing hydrogenase delta subunit
MKEQAKIGVFLCECGQKIAPLVDLKALAEKTRRLETVAHCETVPYPCLQPGLDQISGAVMDYRLNRIVVAGCEGRLMLHKFEKELRALELQKGQIDMVNVRGHVAAVSDSSPGANAEKAAKLVRGAVAEMAAMAPSIQSRANIDGPVIIVGGGVASYTAAEELARRGIQHCLTASDTDPEDVVRALHRHYPGEWSYYDRLRNIVREVHRNRVTTILPSARIAGLAGVTGQYTLTLVDADETNPQRIRCGAIIACLDADLTSPGPGFGHDGQNVLTQPEMEAYFWQNGVPKGRIVFWVSDYESGQGEFAGLSSRSAWAMACHIRKMNRNSEVILLYNQQMAIPLSAAERSLNRKMGISWVPYNKALRPTVQDRFITFCNLADHMEHEIQWDMLVLSPVRGVGGDALETALTLGLVHKEERFLTGHHARVRPEMIGREETYLAGSARYPCNLHDALHQGRKAGRKTADLVEKANAGELFTPRVVCVVDPDKCVGCGQCQELCDCGGIGVADGMGGGLPRVVDPMVCTGGGTCAAACPYHALVLQNSSTDQREARVAAVAGQLAGDEVLAYACQWAGLPAADNAAKQGLRYDPRVHILGVPCVGQLDPCIMARAFLEGAPGLILVGCMPEDCHHSYGVDHAWSRVSAIKKLLSLSGFDRRRIVLAHADLNDPEAFIRTVEGFVKNIATLGPIERTPENVQRLKAMYALIRDNTRVRHLISAGLRRPWEESYRGDQRHALEYDRDFSLVLTEEFLQQRLRHIFEEQHKPYRLNELATVLHEQENQIMEVLWDMVCEGKVELSHENREPVFTMQN